MSTAKSLRYPKSYFGESRRRLCTIVTFLLGKHAMFGHEPPTYLRSITATRRPAGKVTPRPFHPATAKSPVYSSTLSYCPEGVVGCYIAHAVFLFEVSVILKLPDTLRNELTGIHQGKVARVDPVQFSARKVLDRPSLASTVKNGSFV